MTESENPDSPRTVTVGLAKDEVQPFRILCSEADIDADPLLEGQQLTMTPDLYVMLASIFASIGAEEMTRMSEGLDGNEDMLDTIDSIMQKGATRLKQAGLNEETKEIMTEHWPEWDPAYL